MPRRAIWIAAGALALIVVGGAAALYWFLSGDGIRLALERQATAWLGQPVRIGSASAALFPRLALRLTDVQAGDGAEVTFAQVDLSTGLRPLLERRIEDANVLVSGGRLQMPLPFALPTTGAVGTGAAMSIVSIRTIALDDVILASRGRELALSASSSLTGTRLQIDRVRASSGATVLDATGTVELAPRLSATITATANQLDFDDLLALSAAFTPGTAGAVTSRPTASVTATITAPRARLVGVPVSRFEASLLADGTDVRIEPLKFDIFGGRYDGWFDAVFDEMLNVRVGVGVSNVDVAQLAAFGGSAGAMTGRLYGSGRFGARGTSVNEALRTLRGVGEASINDGAVQNLQLLRTVLDFLGGRRAADRAGGERFESISATFALADRVVRSDDLTLRTNDFDVFARGTLALDGTVLDARADLVLSDQLSAQAPSNVYRFTRAGNRIVLPALVSGSLTSPRVRIDTGAVARRGLQNEIERRLQDLLERVPRF